MHPLLRKRRRQRVMPPLFEKRGKFVPRRPPPWPSWNSFVLARRSRCVLFTFFPRRTHCIVVEIASSSNAFLLFFPSPSPSNYFFILCVSLHSYRRCLGLNVRELHRKDSGTMAILHRQEALRSSPSSCRRAGKLSVFLRWSVRRFLSPLYLCAVLHYY